MKIKIGTKEIKITQLFDTAQKRAESQDIDTRQIIVYLKEPQSSADVQALLDEGFEGSVTLIKENSDQEVFTGIDSYVLSRNIEEGSEKTTIRFY